MGVSMQTASQPQASIFMKSFLVLKPLVEKLGLQARVPSKKFLLSKIYRRLMDNGRAEMRWPLAEIDDFVFQNVRYEGDKPLSYRLRFEDPGHFTIFDGDQPLISSSLGADVELSDCAFSIVKTPCALKIGTFYELRLDPWIVVAQSLRKELRIQSNKNNKSILELSLLHRNRHLAMRLLNELMAQYQQYLKLDHDETALGQLAYLNQKQEQIYDKMSQLFQEHASYLKQSLETKGIAGLKDELATVAVPYRQFQEALLAMDMEMSRLNQMGKEGRGSFSSEASPFFKAQQQLAARVQDLKQQRDLLEISLQSRPLCEAIEGRLAHRQYELDQIRQRQERAKSFLEFMEAGPEAASQQIFDEEDALGVWISRLIQDKHPEDAAQYLANYVRLLSVQEKILQEKYFYGEELPSHFEGIDLKTARLLFVDYNKKLDITESSLRYYQQLIEKIKENDFEISALSSILKDSLSQKLIHEANQLSLQLKDEKYRSEKEGERWKEALWFQTKILVEHLEQLHKIEQLNSEVIREKMVGLQHAMLDCIHREISVLYEGMSDSLKERKESLFQEKKIIEQKMEELRHVSADFPEKWRQEKWLSLNIDMGLKMIEVMTELVEGKTVAQHLHHIESKPLDMATLPLLPDPPALFRTSFLLACIAGLAFFFTSLVRTIFHGFPTTLSKLKALKYPTCGPISACCDGPLADCIAGSDLESLRQLSLFIDAPPSSKIIGLMANRGADYSYVFAEHLAKISHRSLIVRCDFDRVASPSDAPGLLQVWQGEIQELPLRRKEGFDYLSAGGFTSCSMELVQSKMFQQLLNETKKSYDFVFLLFRSPLCSAEASGALRLCDQAIVTVCGEPLEELAPFIQWAYHEGKCRLTFITSDRV
jgi:hypothetical protein